jgi:cellulose synthase/poly-beta-1,6-N-acetylglucosamine synthase-like glycosyltransferase
LESLEHPEVKESIATDDWEEFLIRKYGAIFGEPEYKSRVDSEQFIHCFESRYEDFAYPMVHLNMIWCIKQKNMRKLNTHLWFFGGFCQLMNPKYVCLLDVGTKPLRDSLYNMWEALVMEPRVGGVCGEIRPMGNKFLNFVASA